MMATAEEESRNMLYFGDNKIVLRQHIKGESVDLIYLDPPFKSQQDYNVLFAEKNGSQSAAQIRAFEDTWHWDSAAHAEYVEVVSRGGRTAEVMQAFHTFLGRSDMMAYLAMMATRLLELRRVLKDSGTIYLHCDPTASHYLKMLMDAVFGPENFLNEVIWRRTGTHSSANRWGPVHDVLLCYAKVNGRQVWNRPYEPLSEEHRRRHYTHVDGNGRLYAHGELTAPGVRHGRSGDVWKGFDVTAMGRHWITTVDKLDGLDQEGRIYWPPDGGWPRLVRLEEESKGRALGDVWTDIPPINMKAKERLGYPTQKPEALLERIIRASSNEGDIVLDPFCGCGTTISVAQRLKRRWVGIDITQLAITLMKIRLEDAFGDEVSYAVDGEPTNLQEAQALAADPDKYKFQNWALSLVHARPTETKKGADKGIDGKLTFFVEPEMAEHIIFSVKSGSLTPAHVRDLHGTVDRDNAAIGVLISMEEPTRQTRAEAVEAGMYVSKELGNPTYPKIQLLTIKDLFAGKKVNCPASVYHREANPTFKKAPKAKREPKQKEKQSKLSEHSS